MIGKIIALFGLIFGAIGLITNSVEVGFILMCGLVIFGFLFEWRFEDDKPRT